MILKTVQFEQSQAMLDANSFLALTTMNLVINIAIHVNDELVSTKLCY